MTDFDESKHPRDDHGRFVSAGAIAAAKKDPAKLRELASTVTDPEQRRKLERAVGQKLPPHKPPAHGKPDHGDQGAGKAVAITGTSANGVKVTMPPDVVARATKILGELPDPGKLADLAGAQADAKVTFDIRDDDDGNVGVYVRALGADYDAKRVIFRDHVHNQTFEVKQGAQGHGLGTKVFAQQVASAAAAGMKYIDCEAGGWGERWLALHDRKNVEGLNGFYTWPRLGYDAAIDTEKLDGLQKRELAEQFPKAKRVSDLMKTQEGRDWWKANGCDTLMKFDLKAGSLSRRVLEAYLKEKQAIHKALSKSASPADERTAGDSLHTALEMPPILSAADDLLLDAIWDHLGREDLTNAHDGHSGARMSKGLRPHPILDPTRAGAELPAVDPHVARNLLHLRDMLGTLLGERPNVANIPAAFWDRLHSTIGVMLSHSVEQAWIDAHRAELDAAGHAQASNEIVYAAANWTAAYAPSLMTLFVSEAREAVAWQVRQWHTRHGAYAIDLRLAFSPSRLSELFAAGQAAGFDAGIRAAQTFLTHV
jgi:hypothetical protein